MKRFKFRRITGLFTALALAAGLWYGAPPAASAVTQADIDAMQDELDGIADDIKELEALLAQIAGDKEQALKQLSLLNDQMARIEDQIAETDAVIAKYDELIQIKVEEIADIEEKEALQYDLFCRQVRSMEEQGSVSYLSILFDCADFTELLDRAMMISEIMDYNNEIINLLLATREELAAAKAELEAERADQQALRDEQEVSRAELEVKQSEAAALVQKIMDREAGYEAAVEELEREDERLLQEMKEAQEELKRQQIIAAESEWYWPAPGFYTLTSAFGPRIHPIRGTYHNHSGTDIGGTNIYGTDVCAAKSGVVTTSGRHVNYGNYVVITHSDGYQTLYAHMSRRAVSEGDTVTQGQTIGYVGSTGMSTGPHLHYEVLYNGSRTDAEQYYPHLDSVFYRKYNT